jgi:hypothetical protein
LNCGEPRLVEIIKYKYNMFETREIDVTWQIEDKWDWRIFLFPLNDFQMLTQNFQIELKFNAGINSLVTYSLVQVAIGLILSNFQRVQPKHFCFFM